MAGRLFKPARPIFVSWPQLRVEYERIFMTDWHLTPYEAWQAANMTAEVCCEVHGKDRAPEAQVFSKITLPKWVWRR